MTAAFRRLPASVLACCLASACSGPSPAISDDAGSSGADADSGAVDAWNARPVACQAKLSPLPSAPMRVIDLPDGRPVHAEVFADGTGYVLLANQLVSGAGRHPVLRYESSDGINFTGPTSIAGSDDWWSPSVVHHDGTWFLFYRYSLWDSGLEQDTIGLATSDDGLQWDDQGVVFEGPGEAMPGTKTLTEPRVWHDGVRFHLYVTAWTEWVVEDVGGTKWSVAHAVSDDGFSFEHVDVPFAARECENTPNITGDYEEFAVGGIVRSACGGELCRERLALVVRHRECGTGTDIRHPQVEVVTSDDGYTFSAPRVSIPDQTYATTALADDDTLWLYSDEEATDYDGQVLLSSVELPTPLCDSR